MDTKYSKVWQLVCKISQPHENLGFRADVGSCARVFVGRIGTELPDLQIAVIIFWRSAPHIRSPRFRSPCPSTMADKEKKEKKEKKEEMKDISAPEEVALLSSCADAVQRHCASPPSSLPSSSSSSSLLRPFPPFLNHHLLGEASAAVLEQFRVRDALLPRKQARQHGCQVLTLLLLLLLLLLHLPPFSLPFLGIAVSMGGRPASLRIFARFVMALGSFFLIPSKWPLLFIE